MYKYAALNAGAGFRVPRTLSVKPRKQGEGEDAEALVTEALVEVRGAGGCTVMGRLDAAHLADHPSAVSALRACIAVRALSAQFFFQKYC